MDKSKPLAAFRRRLGINSPGIALAVVAIVIGLTGAAFAAGGGLTATQKKQVKSIAQTEAKKFAKQGPKGDPGPAGPTGPQGGKGDAGTAGTSGKDGVSAEATSFSGAKAPCTEGGVEIKSAKPAVLLCNGEEGEQGEKGEKGDPWTAGGTLPPGATETGAWTFNGTPADTSGVYASISFQVPLAAVISSAHVHYVAREETECAEQFPEPAQEQELLQCLSKIAARCPAESPLNPKSTPGELCVYEAGGLENATFVQINKPQATESSGAGRSGALLKFTPTGVAFGAGTYAVTGCNAAPGATEFVCPS